jgi:two-component system LytT family response regulator
MLRVAAVDDEPSALADIARHIKANPRLQLVGTADSPAAARRLIEKEKPDAVFLDVEMPGGTGFSIVESLAIAPKVVFVTAHSKNAVQAFDIDAVDFLLKPIQPDRFALTVRRLEKAVGLDRLLRDVTKRRFGEASITVTGHREKHVIRLGEIQMLLAEGDCTRLCLTKSATVLSGRSLGEMQRLLSSPPFVRLSRSVIVNLARVVGVRSLKSGKIGVRLDGRDEPVVLGRAAATKLRQYLAAHQTPAGKRAGPK